MESVNKTPVLNIRMLLYPLLFYNLYKIDLGSDFKKLWAAINSNFELTDTHQFILKLYTTRVMTKNELRYYINSIYCSRLDIAALNTPSDWERFLYELFQIEILAKYN